ncbi:DUF2510 domain-containing protein [Cryobacterium sp. SO1]|uniref:DUF2510 domain-containing protein n=1 Tax=Cryobacterium sp. SO1 TaxID=1897061 RepID=UPI001022A72A|nr:DUF2510 domain-containing protein [Cryobacterium sp. SO1]
MARKQTYPPGWFDAGEGKIRWFDGENWTSSIPPQNNPAAPRGWYSGPDDLTDIDESAEPYFRWWTGSGWGGQYAHVNGRHDVVNSVHEAMVSASVLGGGDQQAIKGLLNELVDWPPLRVKHFTVYTSAVAAGTNIVAVVEWDGPTS